MGLSYSATIAIPLLAALIGIAGAALGLWLTGLRRRVRMMVPFSAGVLLGVALFGLLPELAEQSGWIPSGLLFAAGYGLLLAINCEVDGWLIRRQDGLFLRRRHAKMTASLPSMRLK